MPVAELQCDIAEGHTSVASPRASWRSSSSKARWWGWAWAPDKRSRWRHRWDWDVVSSTYSQGAAGAGRGGSRRRCCRWRGWTGSRRTGAWWHRYSCTPPLHINRIVLPVLVVHSICLLPACVLIRLRPTPYAHAWRRHGHYAAGIRGRQPRCCPVVPRSSKSVFLCHIVLGS